MISMAFVLGIIATYLTAVAGARGHGSRKLWALCIVLGLLIAAGAEIIGRAYLGPNTELGFMSGGTALANALVLVFRLGAGFAIGSLLAVLLFRRKPTVEPVALK